MQAVRAVACIAPAGKSGAPPDWARSAHVPSNTLTMNANTARPLPLNMDLHLIDGVVQIPARVPCCDLGLHSAMAIRSSRHHRVLPGSRRLPGMAPCSPGIPRLLFPQLSRTPTGTRISRYIHLHDIRFARPGYSMYLHYSAPQGRTIVRRGNNRFHI